MAKAKMEVTLRIEDSAELLQTFVGRLADLLREHADAEAHPVARERMRAVADEFETGLWDG